MYSAYQAPAQPVYERPADAPAGWAQVMLLVCAILSAGGMLGGGALIVAGAIVASAETAGEGPGALVMVGLMLVVFAFMAFMAKFIARMVWLYSAWSWLPEDQRYTGSGRRMTPGSAVGFLFIPYFQFVWLFITHLGLCDALDRQAAYWRTPARTPRTLTMIACIMDMPFLNVTLGPLVSPFLWYLVVKESNKVTVEIAQAAAHARGPQGFMPG